MSKLISLCMIVKNEEQLLPRALANLDGFYDELIIVDTGSTDRTVEIAEAHSARVLHFDWQQPGHKGEARNLGIDAAIGKWIVVLDADEVIEKPAELRVWLLKCKAHALHVQFYNLEPDSRVSLVWNQMRIFQRGYYRYQYREHEIPKPVSDDLQEEVCEFIFLHKPPAERKEFKKTRMLERLLHDAEENPRDPHPWYFLHRQYVIAGEYDDAIKAGEYFLKLEGNHDRCECYGNMATCHEQRGETYLALQYLHRALTDQPTRRIWWLRIAELYIQVQQWNIALAYLHGALEVWSQPEQHYNPETHLKILHLIEHCQAQINHAVIAHGVHEEGHTH